MVTEPLVSVYGMTDNRHHNQDWFGIEKDIGSIALIAVADGVSEVSSNSAARAAVGVSLETFRENPTQTWSEYCAALFETFEKQSGLHPPATPSRTTLTLLWIEPTGDSRVVVRYLAIGDSPIYFAYRGPVMDLYPDTYLVHEVHGKPRQVQNPARVYAYVDFARPGGVVGRTIAGSLDLVPGDICLVCTDGLPFSQSVLDDLTIGKASHTFLNSVQADGPESATRTLFAKICDNLSDDATLVTIMVSDRGSLCPNESSRAVAETEAEASPSGRR